MGRRFFRGPSTKKDVSLVDGNKDADSDQCFGVVAKFAPASHRASAGREGFRNYVTTRGIKK